MHPLSPPLTVDIPMLKESDDLAILRVTFVSKITFEKHLLKSLVSIMIDSNI